MFTPSSFKCVFHVVRNTLVPSLPLYPNLSPRCSNVTAADQAVFSRLLSAQISLFCAQEHAWMEGIQVTAYPLFIYSLGDKLPPSSKPGHLPQRFFLLCKYGSCTAAQFWALTLRRGSLLNLSLSSFFTPRSQGGFLPYAHEVHFSGHGSAPPATSAVSVSDPCHVYVYLNRREALHSIRGAREIGACLCILQWRAETSGKELLWGQASWYQWPFFWWCLSLPAAERSQRSQEGFMAVPFSTGWGKCLLLLLIPVPLQLPCGTQSTGNQDLRPQHCRHLEALHRPILQKVSPQGFPLPLIKTSIPTAALLLLLFTQQLGLTSWFLRVAHSTLVSPGHIPWGSCYLCGEGRLTGAFHISCWLPSPFPLKMPEAGA